MKIQHSASLINHHIDAAEMVGGLDYIVHIDRLILKADGIGLEDIPGLIMGQAAALNMIGIVGQIDLHLVIDTAGHLGRFLFPQDLQQRRCVLLFVHSVRLLGIFRNVPSFADKLSIFNSAVSAVIPYTSFGNSPLFSHFRYRYVFHSYLLSLFLTYIVPYYRQNYNNYYTRN